MATKYVSALDGGQMDSALMDMATHTSEAWAEGTRNGTPVSSDDVTYNNNAKYYANRASSDATTANAAAARAEAAVPPSTAGAVFFDRAQSLTTAQQGQAKANINAGGYNQNILDNAYFVGGGSQLGYGTFPINQGGQTSYTGSGIHIDRWKSLNGSGTTTLQSDGLIWSAGGGNAYFQQKAPYPVFINGEYYTMSILMNGTLYTKTFNSLSQANLSTPTAYFYISSATDFSVQIGAGVTTDVINAIKVEKGMVSTIYNDFHDYQAELLKAYQHRVVLADVTYPAIANASAVTLNLSIPTYVQMNSTTSVISITVNWVRRAGYNAAPAVSPSSCTLKLTNAGTFLGFTHGLENITAQETYWVNFSNLVLGDSM